MKRKFLIGLFGLVGLIAMAPTVLRPPKVPAEAIQSSVIRTRALLDRAWALPVAQTYTRAVAWQSNGSVCGPASLANAFRSLGEAAASEPKVLEGSGRCLI